MAIRSSCCRAVLKTTHENLSARGAIRSTKWIVPTVVLALVPKCPMCVAAYIALATGLGVSLSAATWIRTGLIVTCLGALVFLSIRAIARVLTRPGREFGRAWLAEARRRRLPCSIRPASGN